MEYSILYLVNQYQWLVGGVVVLLWIVTVTARAIFENGMISENSVEQSTWSIFVKYDLRNKSWNDAKFDLAHDGVSSPIEESVILT